MLLRLFMIALVFCVSQHIHAKPVQLYTEHISPFQLVEDNKLIGGTAHVVVLELMNRLRLDANYIALPWVRSYQQTLKEKNSLIYSIARSPQREKQFKWIGKIQNVRYDFYSTQPENEGALLTPKRLHDLNIIAVRGSVEAELLEQIGFEPNKNLYYSSNYNNAFKMVLKNRVDAIYANQFAKAGIQKSFNLSDSELVPVYTLNQSFEVYLAANKDSSPEFIETLKNEYKKMENEGLVNRLVTEEHKRILSDTKPVNPE